MISVYNAPDYSTVLSFHGHITAHALFCVLFFPGNPENQDGAIQDGVEVNVRMKRR